MTQSFSEVFNPATCLPWWQSSKQIKQGFSESLYGMRSKFIVWWCVAFSVPVIFIAALGAKDGALLTLAVAYLALYAVCIAVFMVPSMRSYILRGKYNHLTISALVIISYSAVILVNVLGPSKTPYGGLPLLRRSLFAVMLIICVIFVHANTFVVAICHFGYFATTIQIVGQRELDATAFLMSSLLYGIVSIMLFFAYYHICFVRCQEFLLREHAVSSRAASVASKLTNNFICQVLHDLGTPLTTISLGVREIEAEGIHNSVDASYLKDMKLACWYLKSLRDRAIQYARLTMKSSLPYVRISTINIREFLAERFFPLAQAYKAHSAVELRLNIHNEVPELVQTEPDWLMDILLNLVSNAFKFTAAGHVTVTVVRAPSDDGHAGLQFCVADTGPGVPDLDKQQLFQAFEQGAQVDKVFQGTGLGLWSVRMKAEALGGSWGVRDNTPTGSIFFVILPSHYNRETIEVLPEEPATQPSFDVLSLKLSELPLGSAQRATKSEMERTLTESLDRPSEASTAVRNDYMRVLVIDDQTIIRRMLRKAFERRGVSVDEARDGKEGLEMMKAEQYDCVLSDLLMPEMDGFEMIEQLRAWEAEQEGARHQLVFALSGTCLEESREVALMKGMDAFFAKPIDVDLVMAKIQSYRPPVA